MATPRPQKKEFDLKLLGEMVEPIAIRIVRLDRSTGGREPIALPQAEWNKTDAANIEGLVLKHIAGGGSYEGQISDASGKGFTWPFHYSETYYPPKVPPGSQAAAVMSGAAPLPVNGGMAAAPPGTVWMPQPGMNVPQVPTPAPFQPQQPHFGTPFGYPQPSPYGYPQPSPFGYPSSSYSSPFSTPVGFGGSPAQGSDSEVKQLRADIASQKRESQETRHKAEREAADNRHTAEMASLKEEIRRLGDTKPRGDDDPMLATLRTELAALHKKSDEDRQRFDGQQQDTRHRDEMGELRRSNDAKFEALQRSIEKMSADATANHSDPLITMLTESSRQNADAQRETNRLAAETSREQARASAAAPQNLLAVVEGIRRTSGSDQLMSNVANAYDGAMGMMTRNMEMMNQFALQGQGSPVVGLVADGIQQAKELAAGFMKGKQEEEIAKSRVEQAKVQAQAAASAAQAAAMHAQAAGPVPSPQVQADVASADAAAQQAKADQAKAEADLTETRVKLPKEEQIFGPTWPEVEQLRGLVADGKVDAEQVALGICKAQTQLEAASVVVPAFTLLAEQRFAELFDYMLPNASIEFKGECVTELRALLQRISVDGPGVIDEMIGEPDAA